MRIFLIIAIILFLTSCQSVYRTHYTYLPAPSGMAEMCIAKCYKQRVHCQQMHDVRRDHCKIQGTVDAYYRYHNYQEQRNARNLPNHKFITDFDDSAAHCNQEPCLCVMNYNSCYRECGGEILESQEKIQSDNSFFRQ